MMGLLHPAFERALRSTAAPAPRTSEEEHMFDPIRRSVRVERTAEDTFRLFTEHIGDWWPTERLSRTADGEFGDGVKLERVVFEPEQGGRVYEVTSDGREGSWAEILVYDPPRRIVLAWKPNDRDRPPTEVEVRFEADGDGTRIDLEHSGWDRLGDLAARARQGYSDGWRLPLDRFVAAAAAG
jgi:uncharacterized protein YndB with AHSA1/START domain